MFETAIGWFGIRFSEAVIHRIKFGFAGRAEAIGSFQQCGEIEVAMSPPIWQPRLEAYAEGSVDSFLDLVLDSDEMSPFQKRVCDACRQIPYGSVVTYGKLAEMAGSPGAARAIGTTMSTNRFPIVVPCHRVVAARGLGGFSASGGVATKAQLLTLERSDTVASQRILFE